MIRDCNDDTGFMQKLLLIDRHVWRRQKGLGNNSSANAKSQ